MRVRLALLREVLRVTTSSEHVAEELGGPDGSPTTSAAKGKGSERAARFLISATLQDPSKERGYHHLYIQFSSYCQPVIPAVYY